MALWKDSNAGTVSLLREGKFDQVAKSVSNRVADLLDCEPIQSLISHAGTETVKAYIEAELIKLAGNFNGNPALNLKDYQVPVIAEMLIENYKWESIEDFTLCFKRAGAGMYGEIYRIDGAVIGQWFSRYLDEKYDALEQRKAKEKHADKDIDLTKVTQEHVAKFGPGSEYYKEAQRIADDLINASKPAKGPRQETEFQLEKLGYTPPTAEEVEKKLARIRELQIKALRDKHPGATDEELNKLLNKIIS